MSAIKPVFVAAAISAIVISVAALALLLDGSGPERGGAEPGYVEPTVPPGPRYSPPPDEHFPLVTSVIGDRSEDPLAAGPEPTLETRPLTAEELARAEKILREHPQFVSRLSHLDLSIKILTPSIRTDKPVGVLMRLTLSDPLPPSKFLGTWPYFTADPAAPDGRRLKELVVTDELIERHLSGMLASHVHAVIDLEEDKVIELMPSFEPAPRNTSPPLGSTPISSTEAP